MSFPCDQCAETFDSNFRLYSHRAETHLPIVGLVNNEDVKKRGIKRLPSSVQTDEQPPSKSRRIGNHGVKRKKPPTFSHGNKSKRRVYQEDVSSRRSKPRVDDSAQVRKIIKQGVKRLRETDDEDQNFAPNLKSRRVSSRGHKRHRLSDSESDTDGSANPNKYRKVKSQGTKRFRSSDEDLDVTPKKRRRNRPGDACTIPNAGNTIHDAGSTMPDGATTISGAASTIPGAACAIPGGATAISGAASTISDAATNKIADRKGLVAKMKSDIARWKRLYEKQNYKMRMDNAEFQRKIKILKEQLEECEEFGESEYDLTKLSKSIYNSVTIEEFNRIRTLLSNNQIDLLLRGRKNILALQKMASALTYGIIPITNPQRVALSDREKKLVKDIETATVDDVREHIKNNLPAFLKLFSTIEDSLKLVAKTFLKYGLT